MGDQLPSRQAARPARAACAGSFAGQARDISWPACRHQGLPNLAGSFPFLIVLILAQPASELLTCPDLLSMPDHTVSAACSTFYCCCCNGFLLLTATTKTDSGLSLPLHQGAYRCSHQQTH